ncbi:hypothetical protein [Longimicrobium sp.]|uniref:hypothetical protein n=1 Tax=Longimicrobium sp. TaxID=2029185 RepID=UPI003B3ACF67
MEGILALMIPVLAMATGFVAVLRMPPEKLGRGRRGQTVVDVSQTVALIDEVAQLREELARTNERLDFAERLLMDPAPAARRAVSAPAAGATQTSAV